MLELANACGDLVMSLNFSDVCAAVASLLTQLTALSNKQQIPSDLDLSSISLAINRLLQEVMELKAQGIAPRELFQVEEDLCKMQEYIAFLLAATLDSVTVDQRNTDEKQLFQSYFESKTERSYLMSYSYFSSSTEESAKVGKPGKPGKPGNPGATGK